MGKIPLTQLDQATKTMEGERREILTALEAIYKLEKNV